MVLDGKDVNIFRLDGNNSAEWKRLNNIQEKRQLNNITLLERVSYNPRGGTGLFWSHKREYWERGYRSSRVTGFVPENWMRFDPKAWISWGRGVTVVYWKKKKKKGRRWESQRAEETGEGLKLSSWTVGKQVKWEASGWLGCVKKNPPEGGEGDYTLTTGCLLWHFLQQTRRFRGNQRQHTVGFTPGWVFATWRWESASGWREFSIMLRMLRNQGTMESKKRSLVD